jgi:hypothetical protein
MPRVPPVTKATRPRSFSPPPRHGASCCSVSKLVMTHHLFLVVDIVGGRTAVPGPLRDSAIVMFRCSARQPIRAILPRQPIAVAISCSSPSPPDGFRSRSVRLARRPRSQGLVVPGWWRRCGTPDPPRTYRAESIGGSVRFGGSQAVACQTGSVKRSLPPADQSAAGRTRTIWAPRIRLAIPRRERATPPQAAAGAAPFRELRQPGHVKGAR